MDAKRAVSVPSIVRSQAERVRKFPDDKGHLARTGTGARDRLPIARTTIHDTSRGMEMS
jgi:hypothetical protein